MSSRSADIWWQVKNNLFLLSILLYVAVAIPFYFFFEGESEIGVIDPYMTIGALLFGALVIVPIGHALLEDRVERFYVNQLRSTTDEDVDR